MGKGKDSSRAQDTTAGLEHSSAPLSALKDPASFGPPPKHVAIHGAQAGPGGISTGQMPSKNVQKVPGQSVPATSGAQAHGTKASSPSEPPRGPQPRLPPRLPPRQNSHPDLNSPAPPPPYDAPSASPAAIGTISTGAADRLGRSGVNVPGFNIGSNTRSNASPTRDSDPVSSQQLGASSQMNDLQSRFGRLGKNATGSAPTAAAAQSPSGASGGSSWAQKQAAMRTISQARSDPSKVSLSEAKDAATTANNFRERHGAQIAEGARSAQGFNAKYGMTDRLNGGNNTTTEYSGRTDTTPSTAPLQAEAVGKKPPPPIPKKKVALPGPGDSSSSNSRDEAGPPIPMSSKPR